MKQLVLMDIYGKYLFSLVAHVLLRLAVFGGRQKPVDWFSH